MVVRGNLQVKMADRFIRDFKGLSPDIQKEAKSCIEDFKKDPLPNSRRPHVVTSKGERPTIYTMDVTSNKAFKLSYRVEGNVAILLRVATHKTLDRDPGRADAARPLEDFA